MSTGASDPEMRRRFDEAEKIRVGETQLRRPTLRATEETLRAHFSSGISRGDIELENPHVEPRVTDEERARAVPASVLIAVVLRDRVPTVLFTQRP